MAHAFGGSHRATIQNSTLHFNSTAYHTSGTKGFDILTKAVSSNAFHNSDDRPDPPKCHENTRLAVIKKIIDWVTGKIDTNSFVLWLYGPAGAGKSAIARTVAELCEAQKLLLASFFFFRTDSGRNTMKSLVANLAYRVACVVPAARGPIEATIEADPIILSYSLEDQLTKLVFEPLRLLSEQGHFSLTRLPPLVIIDGLDECLDEDVQTNLIRLIASSASKYQLPLKFLIASRPEQDIKFAFASISPFSFLELNKDFRPDEDIHRFLVDKFREIGKYHPLHSKIPSSWPLEEQIAAIVRKASGQFILASLVVRFVNSARHLPTRRLDIILELQPPTELDLPFSGLDNLYTFVLSRAENVRLVVGILGIVIALEDHGHSLQVAEHILGLEDGDASIALIDLGSLLECEHGVIFHHSSFVDFLLCRQRSKDYFIDICESHTQIAQWVLQSFTGRDLQEPKSFVVSINIIWHLRNSTPTIDLGGDLEEFAFGPYVTGYMQERLNAYRCAISSMSKLNTNTIRPRRNISLTYGDLFGRTNDFFRYLKETNRHELHHHHSALYANYVTSLINKRPNSERFHLMSTIWFVLQRPLKSCSTKTSQLRSRTALHPPRLWIKFCVALLGFDIPDVDWDRDYYGLLEFPTGYHYRRKDCEPLEGLYGDVQGTIKLVPAPVLSRRLAGIAISCIQYLRSCGSPRTRRTRYHLTAWARRSKYSPWLSRRRLKIASSQRAKVEPTLSSPARVCKPWSFPQSLHRSRQILASNGIHSVAFYTKARILYLWTLDLLYRVLLKARHSDELLESLSQPFILWPAPAFFPRRVRRVRKAAEEYLEKFGPSSAAEGLFEEVEVEEPLSDEEYFPCPESWSDR